MKTLLLLTNSFPYGTGESFLSPELNYANGFDKIYVCPCSISEFAEKTRNLPDEIECIPIHRIKLGNKQYLRLIMRPCVLEECFCLLGKRKLTLSRIHELLFFMKNADGIFQALKQALSFNSGDSVVIYSYWLYDAAVAGVLFASFLRKKGVSVRVISRAHGFDIYEERARYSYLPMRKYLLHNLDHIYPCSVDGESVLKKEAGKDSEKIACAFLGTEDHGEGPQRREPFHIVSCSYLVPVKRIHLIIEALKQVDFPFIWTHIGSGPLEKEIREAASQLPKNVKAEFLGTCSNEEILAYYHSNYISAIVNVSSSEGIPVSIMEAASFGIPAVATDVGGTHEIIETGKNGFLLPQNFTQQEFLDVIDKIRTMNDDEYLTLCRNARRVWKQKFSAAYNFPKFYGEISK
jgi:colanic acid/amylovoran biosynthesis glycosyltransferase